jgi:hypothetical protein
LSAADPQNWDVCSKFWKPPERTYLATRVGTVVTTDPPVGSDVPYSHTLYEHFQTTSCISFFGIQTCHDADFENMLHIDTMMPKTDSYEAHYRFLSPSITASIDSAKVTLKMDVGT